MAVVRENLLRGCWCYFVELLLFCLPQRKISDTGNAVKPIRVHDVIENWALPYIYLCVDGGKQLDELIEKHRHTGGGFHRILNSDDLLVEDLHFAVLCVVVQYRNTGFVKRKITRLQIKVALDALRVFLSFDRRRHSITPSSTSFRCFRTFFQEQTCSTAQSCYFDRVFQRHPYLSIRRTASRFL